MTKYLNDNRHSRLTLDTLTLAALVHNIGILPILTEAESHPDIFANPTFLQQAIIRLSNKVGGQITRAWGLSDEFTELVESWSDLTILPKEVNYLDFIRAGAIYHNIFKNETTQSTLIKAYVDKGILPSTDYMETEEFEELRANVRAMFN